MGEPRACHALIVLPERFLDDVYGGEVYHALDSRVQWSAPPQLPGAVVAEPALLQTVEALFTGWGCPALDAALLAAAPALRVVFYAAGSVRQIVTEAFWNRGITITSAAAANAIPVAEFALGVIFLSLKHAWQFAREARREGRLPTGEALPRLPGGCGSTVGLISLGQVGRLVARRLASTDVRVIAYDPFVTEGEARQLGVERVELAEVFRRSDVVSLHAPLLPATRGLIRREHFAAMKPGATFLNTARGAIVREDEMTEVLRARPDLTAWLDVTDPEPPVSGSPLYRLPNVILTPHVAGSLGRECRRFGRTMVDELDRYLAGVPLAHEVTRRVAAQLA